MHGERGVRAMPAACALEWDERVAFLVPVRRRMLLLLLRLVLLFLQLLLQVGDRGSIEGPVGDATVLQTPSIIARAVVIVALADYFAPANNDAAVAVVERRLRGLVEAEGQVVVGLHVVG